MKKYYIIRPDGSSIFKLPYPHDFCIHCLLSLLDKTDDKFLLLNFIEPLDMFARLEPSPAVQAESAIAAAERITELELQKQ